MLEKGYRSEILNYGTLINGLCKHRMIDGAQQIFFKMPKQGLSLDIATYNTLMDGLCQKGNRTEALKLIIFMKDRGDVPNMVIYTSLSN